MQTLRKLYPKLKTPVMILFCFLRILSLIKVIYICVIAGHRQTYTY